MSKGSAFYVQSSLARSGFYFEGRVTDYYGSVGLGSSASPVQFDSGGNLYIGNYKVFSAGADSK